jgi:hypothetical protein
VPKPTPPNKPTMQSAMTNATMSMPSTITNIYVYTYNNKNILIKSQFTGVNSNANIVAKKDVRGAPLSPGVVTTVVTTFELSLVGDCVGFCDLSSVT